MENKTKGKTMLSLAISIGAVADVIGIISGIITITTTVAYVLNNKNKR